MPFIRASVGLLLLVGAFVSSGTGSAAAPTLEVGFGKADITPPYAVRLSGYGNRKTMSEGIESKLYTRAIALKSSTGAVNVLINMDAISVPKDLSKDIAERLEKEFSIPRERVVICCTHSHAAPRIGFGISNLFATPMTDEENHRSQAYTILVGDQMIVAAKQAIAALKPARLYLGRGTAGFAAQRRVLENGQWKKFGVDPNGPVDHSLPVLKAVDADGKLLGLVFNYACHCTTLGGDFNKVDGDWAGYAAAELEEKNPGIVAVSTIGCGADANPEPRGKLDMAKAHGKAIALGVEAALAGSLAEITVDPTPSYGFAALPLAPTPIAEYKERLKTAKDQNLRHAQNMLAIHERKGRLPESYPAPVQSWKFGDQLTMIFLGGEVVVEYALRLKKELGPGATWVTAYANDVFGYVASERQLKEKGYEVIGSTIYYNLPGPWAEGVENVLIERVHDLIKNPRGVDRALSPEASRKSFRLHPGFEIELVASEPLIRDPINIEFGDDGKLWVVEMGDYPSGPDGKGAPGGTVKFLEDVDGDGRFDKSTIFLDKLKYPTGVFPWRQGVLVCCAPRIFYAEDTDKDGKADVIEDLYTGFEEGNPQHLVNGFYYGIDNWIYAGGEHGGSKIESKGDSVHWYGRFPGLQGARGGGAKSPDREFNIRGRDFRICPETGLLEPVTGQTQYIRCRDDWNNHFGATNSVPLIQFVFPDHAMSRNPHIALPPPKLEIMTPPKNPPIFPISRGLERFNDLSTAHRFTSACSPASYRDELFGPDFANATFVCEPVHNLVHRAELVREGVTFKAVRTAAEQTSEFLASSDPWSRPCRVLTGPDGALWVVDMYRAVIEHPQWIPETWQDSLDLRAGEQMGRIYRVYPTGKRPGKLPTFADKSSEQLIAALDSANGPVRDAVQRQLCHRSHFEKFSADGIRKLAIEASRPSVRISAMGTLAGLKELNGAKTQYDAATASRMLQDSDPRLLAIAIQFAEPLLATDSSVGEAMLPLASHADLRVRFQLALSLGAWDDRRAGDALGTIAAADLDDRWMRAAVLTSAVRYPETILATVLSKASDLRDRDEMAEQLISTAIGAHGDEGLARVVDVIANEKETKVVRWQMAATASLYQALARKRTATEPAKSAVDEAVRAKLLSRLEPIVAHARSIAKNETSTVADRAVAVRLLGRDKEHLDGDLAALADMLDPRSAPELQAAALESLVKIANAKTPGIFVEKWPGAGPTIREAILNAYLSRPQWTTALLDAVEAGTILPLDLTAATRERLLQSKDGKLRERAGKLLASVQLSDRQTVIEQNQSALTLPGNALRGALVFQAHCTSCHRFRARGREIGPNLAALQDKTPAALLTHVLDPSRAVEAKFRGYLVATSDGRVISGMIVAESASSITIATSNGAQETILRADVESLTSSGKSFMPEGLEKDLAPQALADLFAFIQSSTTRNVHGTQPTSFGAFSQTRFADANINGITFEGKRVFENGKLFVETGAKGGPFVAPPWLASSLPERSLHWSANTNGQSLEWKTRTAPTNADPAKPYVFRVPIVMSGLSTAAETTFQLRIGERRVLDFGASLDDASWKSADEKVRGFYLAMCRDDDSSAGILDIELPAEIAIPGSKILFSIPPATSNGATVAIPIPPGYEVVD